MFGMCISHASYGPIMPAEVRIDSQQLVAPHNRIIQMHKRYWDEYIYDALCSDGSMNEKYKFSRSSFELL